MLFGLETVNLIKDAGFEKNSSDWFKRFDPDGEYDSTIISHHDPSNPYIGTYCATIDTRFLQDPPAGFTGELFQVLTFPRELFDLDSVIFPHMIFYRDEGSKISTWGYGLRITFSNPLNGDRINVHYLWLAPDLDPMDDTPTRKVFPDSLLDEGVWESLERGIQEDLIDIKGLPGEIEVDSFVIYGYGLLYSTWRSQKAFFDGIRLMGYADYDVGVKEILSGDSLEVGTPYQPVARIKNFGRENADTFLVMAEIWDGSSLIYVDTLPWSLDSDTEDTVTFADFDPPSTGPYTLTVHTHMEPDECDEDDEMSKEIGHTSVSENPLPEGLSLEVMGTSRGALKVSFETPNGQVGNLSVYDATGRRIERMAVTRSGSVELGSALASGVYVVRLECDSAKITSKVIVLR
jgi:hypothetical protein